MSELVGRKLGKYTLEAKLGEGGMAAVFRSHHPQFDRPVAIKILPPTIGQDPSFRSRFEREGRTIAGLNHPRIIRVYDIDESGGLFYMVMDLLPGGTLEGRIREGGLDRKWSADVIVKMAEALDYAHVRGVIHRDIKPSNILLDADGQPVLADFGIARLSRAPACSRRRCGAPRPTWSRGLCASRRLPARSSRRRSAALRCHRRLATLPRRRL